MKKVLSFFFWIFGTIFLIFILFYIFLLATGKLSFRKTKEEVTQIFTEKYLPEPIFLEVPYEDIKVSGVLYNNIHSDDLIVLVHGSPGSSTELIDYVMNDQLRSFASILSIDRPGFGNSDYGTPHPSLEFQVGALRKLIEQLGSNKRTILLGHSLGGPIVSKYAMDYPNETKAIVVVAGSVAPELEPGGWYHSLFASKLLNWTLSGAFHSSNIEIMKLKPELEKMLPNWKNITCKVSIIHGEKDDLVTFKNVAFMEEMLTNVKETSIITNPNWGHLIPFKEKGKQVIVEELISLIKDESVFN